jgi:WD40 repeat protein
MTISVIKRKENEMSKGLILFIMVIFLCGCAKANHATPVVSSTPFVPTLTTRPSDSPVPSRTPNLTPTNTSYPILSLDTLPKGEYFLTFRSDEHLEKWTPFVYSLDGKLQGMLPFVSSPGPISPDLKYIAELPYLLNLETQERIKISGIDGCSDISWSPDSLGLIAGCSSSTSDDVLFYISVIDKVATGLGGCDGNTYNCGYPAWSPDGKWIAYVLGRAASGTSQVNGLHIMDAKCLALPDSCMNVNETGVPLIGPYTWSPDSKYIAGRANGVGIYSAENKHVLYYRTILVDEELLWLSWSVDGKWIAIEDYYDKVSLLSIETGKFSNVPIEFCDYLFAVR